MIDARRDEISRLHDRIQKLEQENTTIKAWVNFYRSDRKEIAERLTENVCQCRRDQSGGISTSVPTEE